MAALHGPPSTKPRLPISQRWQLAFRGWFLGARARGARAARCGATRPGAARRGEPRRELGLSRMVSRRDRRGPRHARPVVERRYVPARRVGFESLRVLSALAPSSPFASAKTLQHTKDEKNGIDHHPGKTE